MTDRQFKTITKKLHFYNQGGIKNLCTMTETMLRQVMEEAAGVTQAYIRKLVQHDVDQQNKIALLSAKVYKLEKAKQDQEWQQQELANKADTNHALVEQMAKLNEENALARELLGKWYGQHSEKGFTETFYQNLLRETEKLLWSEEGK